MASSSNDVHAELQSLKEDFAKLQGDVSGLMQALVDASKQKGTAAAESLNESFEHAQKRGKESINHVEHKIEDHPWTSVGVALSAGLVIGFLLRR